jgi:hypothetical protein
MAIDWEMLIVTGQMLASVLAKHVVASTDHRLWSGGFFVVACIGALYPLCTGLKLYHFPVANAAPVSLRSTRLPILATG